MVDEFEHYFWRMVILINKLIISIFLGEWLADYAINERLAGVLHLCPAKSGYCNDEWAACLMLCISSVHDNARGDPDGEQIRSDGDVADQRVADDSSVGIERGEEAGQRRGQAHRQRLGGAVE